MPEVSADMTGERVRVLFSGDGYRMLSDGRPGDATGWVYEHRLTAYAWGLLDGLDDDRQIHHVDHAPAHSAEDNLVAVGLERHAEYHLLAGEEPDEWAERVVPTSRQRELLEDEDELEGEEQGAKRVVAADGGREDAYTDE